jgi:hypothetical protein
VYGIERGGANESRQDNLIAFAHAKADQGKVKRSSAGTDGNTAFDTNQRGNVFFKFGSLFTLNKMSGFKDLKNAIEIISVKCGSGMRNHISTIFGHYYKNGFQSVTPAEAGGQWVNEGSAQRFIYL